LIRSGDGPVFADEIVATLKACEAASLAACIEKSPGHTLDEMLQRLESCRQSGALKAMLASAAFERPPALPLKPVWPRKYGAAGQALRYACRMALGIQPEKFEFVSLLLRAMSLRVQI
jgi:hypothetical protein